MSGQSNRRDSGRGESYRAQLPLLDRLIDDAPDNERDPPLSATEAMGVLRRGVRRDLEALLNARRRWRSWPSGYSELKLSPLAFGIPDFTVGGVTDARDRQRLCQQIEDTIRLFEPRFASVHVSLSDKADDLDANLRLRIEALLHAEPAPEPIAFDTMIDPSTADALVRSRDDV
jgi:type VI secretion system protein ImpF